VTTKRAFVCIAVLVLGGILVPADRARAQVQLTPAFGIYIPHGGPLLEEPGTTPGKPLLRKAPIGAALLGARLSKWFSPRIGIEGNIGYSLGLIAVRNEMGVSDVSASLTLASVTAQYRVNASQDGSLAFQLGSGIGYVGRGGRAWADTPASPSLALVLSVGAHALLDPRRRVTIRGELEDYISWPQFRGSRSLVGAYHDPIFSIGIGIPISGHNKSSGRKSSK